MNRPAGPERRSVVLWSRNLPVALCLSLWTLASGCGGEPVAPPGAAADRSAPDEPWFTDRAKESGLDFMHGNGASGQFFIPEILAPGSALFDFDNDGDLDIFIPQGGLLGGRTGGAAPLQVPGSTPPQSRLYRNDLQIRADGSRALSFTDVTQESHIQVPGYPMGAAAADVNNDGCVDLFVTGFGRNYLFRNGCDGSFTDIWKDRAPDWAVSASFLDYDRDGWLDLYVGNYVHYSLDTTTKCQALSGEPDYCTPQAFRPQSHRLYRNTGGGAFVDVTARALSGNTAGPALGVSTADFNQDGWIDIYVANDGAANMLWMNERDGTFRDTALLAGAALSAEGKPEGSMGVDAGDFDNDGDEDLFMTHLPDEGNNLYVNDGSGMVEDQSARSGLGPLSLGYTGFGTAWFDYDNDGWLDILAVNGAVSLKAMRGSDRIPYNEPNRLFHNLANGRFEDVTSRAGPVFQLSEVSRGASFGDIDNDGDTDVLVTNNNGPVRLLLNGIGHRRHWLGLRLVGAGVARDMIGSRVAVTGAAGRTLWRRARSDGSYASANDPRVLFGLGDDAGAVGVRVIWPDGASEEWSGLTIDRWMTLERGTGR
jgi:hypothetical protein